MNFRGNGNTRGRGQPIGRGQSNFNQPRAYQTHSELQNRLDILETRVRILEISERDQARDIAGFSGAAVTNQQAIRTLTDRVDGIQRDRDGNIPRAPAPTPQSNTPAPNPPSYTPLNVQRGLQEETRRELVADITSTGWPAAIADLAEELVITRGRLVILETLVQHQAEQIGTLSTTITTTANATSNCQNTVTELTTSTDTLQTHIGQILDQEVRGAEIHSQLQIALNALNSNLEVLHALREARQNETPERYTQILQQIRSQIRAESPEESQAATETEVLPVTVQETQPAHQRIEVEGDTEDDDTN